LRIIFITDLIRSHFGHLAFYDALLSSSVQLKNSPFVNSHSPAAQNVVAITCAKSATPCAYNGAAYLPQKASAQKTLVKKTRLPNY